MRRTLPVIYLALNLGCALLVLAAARHIGAVAVAEQRTAHDGVDGVTFFAAAAPTLALAFVVNTAWAARALADAVRRRTYAASGWLAAVAVLWAGAALGSRLN